MKIKNILFTLLIISMARTSHSAEVVCKTHTGTKAATKMQSDTVTFSENDIRFTGPNGYKVLARASRTTVQDWSYLNSETGEIRKAKKYTLYSGDLFLANYYITENSNSEHNRFGSDVARLAEPEVLKELSYIYGLDKAVIMSQWLLSSLNCFIKKLRTSNS